MRRVFYRDKDCKVEEGVDLPRLSELLKGSHACVWVDLEGEPPEALEAVAREFSLHPVTIEDLVHRNQRPKLEEFDSYIFIVTHGLRSIQGEEVVTDEFNFALGDNWILSAHDGHVEAMKRVYDQVVATPKAFDGGASFILYRMSDLLVDSYFPALDALEEQTDTLEDDVVQRPTQARLQQIFALKRVLVHLRKLVSPQREVYNALSRRDHPYIDPKSAAYFRDLHDHLIRASEIVESYRDLVSNMLDAYLATISNRLNEVMKRLTLLATIFMPITFITGFFGMNFTAMPFTWTWLLWITIAAMVITPLAMLVWFVRSGWIGGGTADKGLPGLLAWLFPKR
jgi:magnesium transporter